MLLLFLFDEALRGEGQWSWDALQGSLFCLQGLGKVFPNPKAVRSSQGTPGDMAKPSPPWVSPQTCLACPPLFQSPALLLGVSIRGVFLPLREVGSGDLGTFHTGRESQKGRVSGQAGSVASKGAENRGTSSSTHAQRRVQPLSSLLLFVVLLSFSRQGVPV